MNRILIATLLVICLSSPALAQHAGDVLLTVERGQIVTNLIDEKTETVTPNVRVFAAEFGDTGTPTFTSNPGFDSESGTFPADSAVGFNILDAVMVWTGDGFEPADDEAIIVSFAATVVTSGDGFVPGFSLPVSPSGQWHRHLGYTLSAKREPVPGVYLLELEMFCTSPAIGSSAPFWKVFNFGVSEEEHESALAWAMKNLAATDCPADLTDDGAVNAADLAQLLGAWGACPTDSPCPANLNGDGVVNAADLAQLLGQWGECA